MTVSKNIESLGYTFDENLFNTLLNYNEAK